jgi:hypothetical protein
MYKKTSVIMAAMLAAVLAVGLTANHAFVSVAGNKNQGTTNVAIGGDGGIGGAGGPGGTVIGGYAVMETVDIVMETVSQMPMVVTAVTPTAATL